MILLILFQGQLYFIMFKSFEKKYKSEVKQLIKDGVDDRDLVAFTFPVDKQGNIVAENFRWIKENEFRFDGEMYDIVNFEKNTDSISFYCIHDFKESRLFENLDKYLTDYLNNNPEKKNQTARILNSISLFYIAANYFELINYSVNSDKLENRNFPSILLGYHPNILHPPQFS